MSTSTTKSQDAQLPKAAGLNSDDEIAAFTGARGAGKAPPPSTKAKANGAPKSAGLNSDDEIAAFTGAGKASPPSNKAKANGAPKLSNFGTAFKSARSSGKSEFTFGGKKYNTKLKGE